jgi:predicted membrane protein
VEQTLGLRPLLRLDRKLPVNAGEEYKDMPLINLVITLIVVGMLLWLINRFIPMASSIKTILNVVVVVFVGIWVLQAVGLWGDVSTFRIGR